MRILQVRFRNLNSLVGEWEIDLTHPAFTSDGIFAITGPTGAGKTTILDALCLALYGSTPRLGKVTRSGNEIMSRQTGACFAEVTFETQAGRFRCHWSQHRARRKPDGELQAPKHEIAEAESGRIIEARLRDVAETVEKVTGMDFDRFTRSMLLAQGGFAAFLQAAPDERAPILEQITGTEIYSRISIRVHERRAEERKRLDTLQAELAGMQLLTPEEEQQLGESLEQKCRQDTELNRQIDMKNQALAWLEGVARLEEELKQLGRAQEELTVRMEAFAPEQARLDAATRALELAAGYAALSAIRREQETDGRTLLECRESLPGRTDAARRAEEVMNAAAVRLAGGKTEQQMVLPVIRKARELDLKMAERDAPITAAQEAVAELAASLGELKTRQESDSAELAGTRRALEDVQQLLEAIKADEGLVELLAGIRGRFETVQSLNGQLRGKLDEITGAESRFRDASRTWDTLSNNLESEKRGLEAIQASLAERQAALLGLLGQREPADWRKSLSLLTARKELTATAVEAARTLSQSKRAALDLANRQAALSAEVSALTGTLASYTERQSALEKEQGQLETQLTLLRKIEDLEDARRQLRDGEPCPLCGAREHPFAEGNVPVPDETRRRLIVVRGDLKSVVEGISDARVRLAGVRKDLEQAASGRDELAGKIVEAGRRIGEACAELPPELELTASDPELGEKLDRLQAENARLLAHVAGTVEAAETVEKELSAIRASFEKARDSVAQAEREAQAAAHGKDSAGQLLERLKMEADGCREQRDTALVQALGEVRAYGVETLSIDCLDGVLGHLSSRRDRWLARQKEKTGLDQKIAALGLQARHQAEQIGRTENELARQRDQLEGLLREREAWARERQELFGDRKPDEEEARLAAAIASADEELDAARKKSAAANQELGQLKAGIDELEKAMGARDLQLESWGEAFRARLEESGFSDEENYRSACLPENERKQLAEQSRRLSDAQTELAAREREKTGLLEMERRKRVTEETPDALKDALAALVCTQKELQQEIGGIRQKLRDNDSLKQRQQERVHAIDAQRRECSRWDLLHELIGSADGKKYRNFAQGLTFEMMIGHANRQLQKLSDRYLLIRDDDQPLELNVIDNYQAGEVRSTKNLSGGESFIVSLSLALGLSHMASRNVRVDSLFLDEGFGTLDEEALDTALETLAGLRHDGKLIGVISHVAALKERIAIQLQVAPRTGGISVIAGPGVRKS